MHAGGDIIYCEIGFANDKFKQQSGAFAFNIGQPTSNLNVCAFKKFLQPVDITGAFLNLRLAE
jgi:hypothetical protein